MLRVLAFLLLLPWPAMAQADRFGTVELIAGPQAADGTRHAALVFDLAPGWNTYWRIPGSSGVPPQFNWLGSDNLADIRVVFPRPQVRLHDGMQTNEYRGHTVWPIVVTAADPGAEVTLDLALSFGVCAEVCIPMENQFTLSLPPGSTANAELVASALALAPTDAAGGGVRSARCSVAPDGRNFTLTSQIELSAAPDPATAVIVEPGSDLLWADIASVAVAGNTLTATTPLQFFGQGGLALDRSRIRLTLLSDSQAIDITGCPSG